MIGSQVTLDQKEFIQEQNYSGFNKSIAYGLIISLFSSGLLVIIFYVFAEPIVKIIFEHGIFSSHDSNTTASTLRIYSLGSFPFLILPIITNVYYSLRMTLNL